MAPHTRLARRTVSITDGLRIVFEWLRELRERQQRPAVEAAKALYNLQLRFTRSLFSEGVKFQMPGGVDYDRDTLSYLVNRDPQSHRGTTGMSKIHIGNIARVAPCKDTVGGISLMTNKSNEMVAVSIMDNPTQITRIDMLVPRLKALPVELLDLIMDEVTRSRAARTIQRFMRGLSQRLITSDAMVRDFRRFGGFDVRASQRADAARRRYRASYLNPRYLAYYLNPASTFT